MYSSTVLKLQEASLHCVCTAAVALQQKPSITCSSYLSATVASFGVFRYKCYVMLFLRSCFVPYKRYNDIVDVACYI